MLIVQPKPKRNWYHYSSEQMSGPLPGTLYKYVTGRYGASMIDRGELMFSTLAWFQNYEDDQRGDRFEGTRKYFPVGGLDITRTEGDGKPHRPVSFKAPTDSLQSRATGHNHIFIYSTSLRPGLAFDGADACVEIYDPVKFVGRLRSTLQTHRSAKAETLIHDAVKYYDFVGLRLRMCGHCRTCSRCTNKRSFPVSANTDSPSVSGGTCSILSTSIALSCVRAKRCRFLTWKRRIIGR
jgi:hypothetical protein